MLRVEGGSGVTKDCAGPATMGASHLLHRARSRQMEPAAIESAYAPFVANLHFEQLKALRR
jgi:hypothetical protein